MNHRANFIGGAYLAIALCAGTTTAAAEDWDQLVKDVAAQEKAGREKTGHPKLNSAIHELQEVIQYLESSPHDFGGEKTHAIDQARKAVAAIRKALASPYVSLEYV